MKLKPQHEQDFESYLISLGLGELTLKSYLEYYNLFVETFEGFFNQKTIDSFLSKRNNSPPRATIRNLLNFLRRNETLTNEEALEISRITILKKTGRRTKKPIQIISENEVLKLIHNCKLRNDFETDIFKLLIAFQYSGGLRITELMNLKFKDLQVKSFDEKKKYHRIKIRPEIAKNKKGGFVYIKTNLIKSYFTFLENLSKELFKKIKDNELTLWCDQTREHYSRNFHKQSFKILEKDLHTHCLRHSKCSNLLASGLSLLEAQKFMRHENAETTLRYYHLLNEDVGKSLEELEENKK